MFEEGKFYISQDAVRIMIVWKKYKGIIENEYVCYVLSDQKRYKTKECVTVEHVIERIIVTDYELGYWISTELWGM